MNVQIPDRSRLAVLTRSVEQYESGTIKRNLLQRRYYAGKADGIKAALPEIHLHIDRCEKLRAESRATESRLLNEIERLQQENAQLRNELAIQRALRGQV